MGELFKARDTRTERRVALKLLRPDNKHRADAIERFRREARAAGMINSDHVTQVLGVEDDPKLGIAIAFELLEGESLLERLRKAGPMSPETIHPLVSQALRGLADAHAVGIIHRDLKPSNVFLERRGDEDRIKILDFGISKLPKTIAKTTLTEPGQSLGSFMFMPPEQIQRAEAVDHRADIYAMGSLVFQAMTGHLPYSARNMVELVQMKVSKPPRTMAHAANRAFPPELEAWVARCLALSPDARFQSAKEARDAWSVVLPAPAAPPPAPRRSAPVGLGSTAILAPPSTMGAPSAGAPPPFPQPQPGYAPPAASQRSPAAYAPTAAMPQYIPPAPAHSQVHAPPQYQAQPYAQQQQPSPQHQAQQQYQQHQQQQAYYQAAPAPLDASRSAAQGYDQPFHQPSPSGGFPGVGGHPPHPGQSSPSYVAQRGPQSAPGLVAAPPSSGARGHVGEVGVAPGPTRSRRRGPSPALLVVAAIMVVLALAVLVGVGLTVAGVWSPGRLSGARGFVVRYAPPRMRARRALALATLTLAASSLSLGADEDDEKKKAMATDLFDHGVKLMAANKCDDAAPPDAGRAGCQEALDYFIKATRAWPKALGAHRNAAFVARGLGKVATAARSFREVARRAPLEQSESRRRWAEPAVKEAEALEPRIPHVTVRVGEPTPPELVLTIDGEPYDATLLATAISLDPGPHQITAEAPGYNKAERKFELVERQSLDVTLALEALPRAPAPLDSAATSAAPPPPPPPRDTTAPMLVTIGGGVLVGVGLAFGAMAKSAKDSCKNDVCKSQSDIDKARSRATLSTAFSAVGLVTAAGGAAWWAFGGSGGEASARRGAVVPVVARDGVGVAFGRAF